jgi:hypothetical protein
VEIHDSTFESNEAGFVSDSDAFPRNFLEISAPIPGGPHGTPRAELFMFGKAL